jgi:hypothetical protein
MLCLIAPLMTKNGETTETLPWTNNCGTMWHFFQKMAGHGKKMTVSADNKRVICPNEAWDTAGTAWDTLVVSAVFSKVYIFCVPGMIGIWDRL